MINMRQKAKKSLGQHFLRCNWVTITLIKTSELIPDDTILEIGPGTGILTRALATHTRQVIAVEKDERLAAELRNSLLKENITNVQIISGDIIELLKSHFNRHTKYKVVANIPYYLTSRLLRLILEAKQKPKLIVLTIQKEVAKRLTAKPPKMNLLALSVQAYGNPEIIKTVPAKCFYPKPKVDSAIIKISDISDQFFKRHDIEENLFFEVIRKVFNQKRKILMRSLVPYQTKPRLEKIFDELGIKTTARPQELTLKQWATIISFFTER